MNLFNNWPADYREQFWLAYPRKVAKIDAMKALEKVRRRGDIPWETIMGAVGRYAAHTHNETMKFIAHPATWLNGGRWDDVLEDRRPAHGDGQNRGPTNGAHRTSLLSIAMGDDANDERRH